MTEDATLVRTKSGLLVRPNTQEAGMVSESKRSYGWMQFKGRRVLDIGANIGAFARMAVDLGGEVLAYEPEYENFTLLCANSPKSTNRRAALVSGVEDEVILYKTTSGKNPGNYSTVPFQGRERVMVPASAIGDVYSEFSPQVIKMDCEGAEYDLLSVPIPDSCDEITIEVHLNKREWKTGMGQLVAEIFSGWECVRQPTLDNPKLWHTLGAWRR